MENALAFDTKMDMNFVYGSIEDGRQFIPIDGQQRLTSLTLILKALYDYLGTLGEEYEGTREEIRDSYLFNKFAKENKFSYPAPVIRRRYSPQDVPIPRINNAIAVAMSICVAVGNKVVDSPVCLSL